MSQTTQTQSAQPDKKEGGEHRSESYRAYLNVLDAEWGMAEYPKLEASRAVVQTFDDPDDAYWAVRRDGAGLVDRSERETLVVTGEDAVPWLQGLVTNDLVELVNEGSGQFNCATNTHGRMVADMRVVHIPEMLMLDLEPGTLGEGGFLSHLRQNIIMEDVELGNRTPNSGRLGLYGPSAPEIVASLANWDRPVDELDDYDAAWGVVDGCEVIVQSNPLVGEPGYDFYLDRGELLTLWRRIEDVGGGDVVPCGHETLETLRIESGRPRFGVETGDDIIPLEAGLAADVSFEKGCYLGQEIIARLDSRGQVAKKLRMLMFDGGAAPAVGATVEADGRDSGSVVSSVWSPLADGPIALAFIKRNAYDVGGEVTVEGRTASVKEAVELLSG